MRGPKEGKKIAKHLLSKINQVFLYGVKNITKYYCWFVGEKTHNVQCVANYPKLLLQRSWKEDFLP